MFITFTICVLSIILSAGYIFFAGRALKKRTAADTSPLAGQPADEDLQMDIAEYRDNVRKTIFISAVIIVMTITTVFIM